MTPFIVHFDGNSGGRHLLFGGSVVVVFFFYIPKLSEQAS